MSAHEAVTAFRFHSREAFHQRVQHATRLITATDLKDQTPRTLLYGWSITGVVYHVYLNASGDLVLMYYEEAVTPRDNIWFIPSKRVQPEWLDTEFVALLDASGHGALLSDTIYGEPATTLFKPGAPRQIGD